jgi:hypothetical protein
MAIMVDGHTATRKDPAESVAASYCPDMAALLDTPRDELYEAIKAFKPSPQLLDRILVWHEQQGNTSRDHSHVLNVALSLILERDRADIAAWALAFAAHLSSVSNLRAGEIADRLGITESAFSKVVNEFCDLLKLPRPPALKGEAARVAYSQAQTRNHFRFRTGRDFVNRRS